MGQAGSSGSVRRRDAIQTSLSAFKASCPGATIPNTSGILSSMSKALIPDASHEDRLSMDYHFFQQLYTFMKVHQLLSDSEKALSADAVAVRWLLHSYPLWSIQNIFLVLETLINRRVTAGSYPDNPYPDLVIRENLTLAKLCKDMLSAEIESDASARKELLNRLSQLEYCHLYVLISVNSKVTSVMDTIRKSLDFSVICEMTKRGVIKNQDILSLIFNSSSAISLENLLSLHNNSEILDGFNITEIFDAIMEVEIVTISSEFVIPHLKKITQEKEYSQQYLDDLLQKALSRRKFGIVKWVIETSPSKKNEFFDFEISHEFFEVLANHLEVFENIVRFLLNKSKSQNHVTYYVLNWLFFHYDSRHKCAYINIILKEFEISSEIATTLIREYFDFYEDPWREHIPQSYLLEFLLPRMDINSKFEENKTILGLVMERTKQLEHIMFFVERGYSEFTLPNRPSLLALASSEQETWNFLYKKVYPDKDYFWGFQDWSCSICSKKFGNLWDLEHHQVNHVNSNFDHFLIQKFGDTCLVLELMVRNGYLSILHIQKLSSVCHDFVALEESMWPLVKEMFCKDVLKICGICGEAYTKKKKWIPGLYCYFYTQLYFY
eukprot:TRINITY_DN5505_c0_g1_i1.p1 TRINITY_DN5505_c0_g1~~TRINITY_DN5505_c0_g1_i1.p1  ORF type:complete len:609 (+),score=84.46 TRINITY_DN5505_c0_g1_i1:30-1856(+)